MKNKLGEKIKTVRENREISIKELSERSDVSVPVIENIEKGDFIPGLSPLIKIARVLGVRLGTFMDDHENIGPVVSRKNETGVVTGFSDKASSAKSDMDFKSLAPDKAGRRMEPFLIDVHPSSVKDFQLSTHEGEEFIYVMSGSITISYGKETYILNEGDSIYYDSIVPHHVHSLEDHSAKILAVVYAHL